MRPINPLNNNGSIQLAFTVSGKRYRMTPIPGGDFNNKRDLQTANAIATRINNDILAGNFDPTLARYRIAPKTAKATKTELSAPKTLLELWDAWVSTLGISEVTKADHYEMTRRMIVKASPKLTDSSWLAKPDLAASTYNKRLGYLQRCGKWAVLRGYLAANPYETLKTRKASRLDLKPFSAQEIRAVLDGFSSLAPHYAPFVQFLLMTGVRTGEATGLTWSHIDFARNELTISESLSKDRTGNGYTKIRKGTKTGTVRVLGLTAELRDLLATLKPAKASPDDLVFQTVKGCPIDAGNFRLRYWKRVLDAANVPYRKPYNCRHTMISHAIDQGSPITGVAYLAGHSDTRMVMQTYGHMVNRPSLPQMPV